MADVLVRNLSDETMEELKCQAEENGRSLQAELRMLLEDAASWRAKVKRFKEISKQSLHETAGRPHSDSAGLIAEDRLR